jgi:MFS family permease
MVQWGDWKIQDEQQDPKQVSASDVSYRLLRHGLLVFLLGLGSGLALLAAPHWFKNPRLAVSSHLVGVTSGMFLICVGVLVPRIALPPRGWQRTLWMLLYGAYGNWAGTLLGAVLGTLAMAPVAGSSNPTPKWEEFAVATVLTTSGIAMIAACVILFRNIRREA